MTVTTTTGSPASVLDVLARLDALLGSLRHALVLGSGGRLVGSAGSPPEGVVALARSLSSALTAPSARLAGESARCVVSLSQHRVLVYVLGVDLAVALVGPPDWNVALTSRFAEPLLVRFVDAYLPELAARSVVPPSAMPRPERRSAPVSLSRTRDELVAKKDVGLSNFARVPLRPQRTPARRIDYVVAQRSPLKRSPLRATPPELIKDPVLLDRVLSGLAGL